MGKSFKSIVESLLGKIDSTSERYEKTAENKQEKLIELQLQLSEAAVKLKEFHKMHILGDISDATYADAKKDVDVLTSEIAELQNQISLIDGYRVEDIDAELAKIEAIKQDFNLEQREATKKIQFELQQAKLTYLMAMEKARTDYMEVSNTDFKLADVLVKLGRKKGHYVSGAFNAVGFPTLNNASPETPFVDKPLVFEVMEYGRIPEKIIKFVDDGKKHGYLK